MRVLVTGAGGFIGRRLVPYLTPHHDLVLGEVGPINDPRARRVDVTDVASVQAACQGVEAIIHLAIASGHGGEYEDDRFNDLRYDVNVKGTRNVFEAAVRCGVRRVVYTSSLMVVWGYGPEETVGPDAPARPVGTYAITKHLGEVIAADYYRQFGVSSACLRIAKPVDLADDEVRRRPILPQWIAVPDLCQAYHRALVAPGLGCEIFHIVGDSSRRRWDLSKARLRLGYEPEFRLEEIGYHLATVSR